MLHFGNTVDNGLGVEMIRLRNPPEVLGCTVRRQHSAAAAVGGDAIRNLFPSVNKAAGVGAREGKARLSSRKTRIRCRDRVRSR